MRPFHNSLLPAVAVACTLLVGVACAGAGRTEEAPSPPRIVELVPDRGPAGTDYPIELTIRGTGFVAGENTVRFGPVVREGVPADDGVIRISVPKELPSPGEVPPAPLPPGRYDVTVTNERGTSPPATFILTEPGGSSPDAPGSRKRSLP